MPSAAGRVRYENKVRDVSEAEESELYLIQQPWLKLTEGEPRRAH